ncbi:MAG: ribonuclease HII, partial [Thermoplasmata archaeon]|nr:ribonuclease HII [Thermoplasmata archaeon]
RSVPRIISEHKADTKYPAVSAASIVAKVTRDREMEKLRQEYGELGSGYPSDPITRAYLLDLFRKGKELPPFVRRSWETIKKIREEACAKRIEDFF